MRNSLVAISFALTRDCATVNESISANTPAPAGRRDRDLVRACAILTAIVLAAIPVAAWATAHVHGSATWLTTLLAAGVCWLGATVSLVVAYQGRQRGAAMLGLMVAMLVRMAIPLGVAFLAVISQGGAGTTRVGRTNPDLLLTDAHRGNVAVGVAGEGRCGRNARRRTAMHDPIFHIKDCYFFEVPKGLWKYHYTKLDKVPKWVRDTAPEVKDVGAFNKALDGKILIPQPFGTPNNLYEPGPGFCISRFMILEVLAAALLVFFCVRLAHKVRQGFAVRGTFWNLLEAMLVFIRDQVAKPAIGAHDADRFVPLLWTLFLFILTCNLFGLIPWLGTPTGAFGTTLALAVFTFLTAMLFGMIRFGPIGYWTHYLPHMEMPWLMGLIIKPMVWFLEVLGMLIRWVVLGFRLLANMVAGHLVLLGILGLILAAAAASTPAFSFVAVISVVASALFSCLELFVAFLQAYIFVFLGALFIGAAVREH